jgi:hypothetical protein
VKSESVVCDKCRRTVPGGTGLALSLPTTVKGAQARSLDLCEPHASELMRFLTEPQLSIVALEGQVRRFEQALQQSKVQVHTLELERSAAQSQLAELQNARAAVPQLPAPAFDVTACYCSEYASSGMPCPPGECPNVPSATEPPAAFAAAPPLPEAFTLPGQAFEFSTEPPTVEPEPSPAASPLSFAHTGQA